MSPMVFNFSQTPIYHEFRSVLGKVYHFYTKVTKTLVIHFLKELMSSICIYWKTTNLLKQVLKSALTF